MTSSMVRSHGQPVDSIASFLLAVFTRLLLGQLLIFLRIACSAQRAPVPLLRQAAIRTYMEGHDSRRPAHVPCPNTDTQSTTTRILDPVLVPGSVLSTIGRNFKSISLSPGSAARPRSRGRERKDGNTRIACCSDTYNTCNLTGLLLCVPASIFIPAPPLWPGGQKILLESVKGELRVPVFLPSTI
ncbi:hypothetical protein BDP55DRAFT_362039 [Colletotrichum godetiae]|uniref:Uncharacterized protein n=1 Tax=Colletotrichum godetiae TaxID=1209918 RepID=A0AAJ0ACW3_9PEZI|nr:uncharacterized protein BDP55DRAFT_362039 [Colletotrichum godetiae]KAK1659302.1 hypothetical protein BDP55DRAFT_362039 [Colletotrichum godetiae]